MGHHRRAGPGGAHILFLLVGRLHCPLPCTSSQVPHTVLNLKEPLFVGGPLISASWPGSCCAVLWL